MLRCRFNTSITNVCSKLVVILPRTLQFLLCFCYSLRQVHGTGWFAHSVQRVFHLALSWVVARALLQSA